MRKNLALFTLVVSIIVIGSLTANHQFEVSIKGKEPSLSTAVSETAIINEKIVEEQTVYENSTFQATINAETYKPGDICTIETTSEYKNMNNSVEWALESPLNEDAFKFDSQYNGIFLDPNFNKDTIVDWTSDGFTSANINTTSNFMNLTLDSGNPTAQIYTVLDLHLEDEFTFFFTYNTTNIEAGKLRVYYYNDGFIQTNVSISTSVDLDEEYSATIYLNGSEDITNKIIYFELDAPTNGTSEFLLDSFSLTYVEEALEFTANARETGFIDHYWYHDSINSLMNFTYAIYEEELERTSLNLTFTIPKDKIYLGDWEFQIIITGVDDEATELLPVIYSIKLHISDEVYFDIEETLVLRGYNTTTDEPIYEKETSNQVFSPNDTLAIVGLLYYNSSNLAINGSVYNEIIGEMNCTFANDEFEVNWGLYDGLSELRTYDSNAENLIDGNLTKVDLEQNVANYYFIYLKIPENGIFGDIGTELNIKFPTQNSIIINNEIVNSDYEDIIEITDLVVKYRVVIEDEVLPTASEYYLLDTIYGEFTFKTQIFNLTLSEEYNQTTRNFDNELNIPISDIHYQLELYSEEIGIVSNSLFIVENIENEISWKYTINPNTDISNNYTLRINWKDATQANDTLLEFIEHETGSITHDIKIVGIFLIDIPQETYIVYQNSYVNIKFSLVLEKPDFNQQIVGVDLYALLNNDSSIGRINVGIEGNSYKITFSPTELLEPGQYNIDIYTKSGYYLGKVTVFVQPYQIQDKDIVYTTPIIIELIGLIAIGLVVASFILGSLTIKERN